MYKGVQIRNNTDRFVVIGENYINNIDDNIRTCFQENDLDILESFDIIFNPMRYI